MPIIVLCPGCGKSLHGKDALAGKRVKCPKCGQELRLTALGNSSPQLRAKKGFLGVAGSAMALILLAPSAIWLLHGDQKEPTSRPAARDVTNERTEGLRDRDTTTSNEKSGRKDRESIVTPAPHVTQSGIAEKSEKSLRQIRHQDNSSRLDEQHMDFSDQAVSDISIVIRDLSLSAPESFRRKTEQAVIEQLTRLGYQVVRERQESIIVCEIVLDFEPRNNNGVKLSSKGKDYVGVFFWEARRQILLAYFPYTIDAGPDLDPSDDQYANTLLYGIRVPLEKITLRTRPPTVRFKDPPHNGFTCSVSKPRGLVFVKMNSSPARAILESWLFPAINQGGWCVTRTERTAYAIINIDVARNQRQAVVVPGGNVTVYDYKVTTKLSSRRQKNRQPAAWSDSGATPSSFDLYKGADDAALDVLDKNYRNTASNITAYLISR